VGGVGHALCCSFWGSGACVSVPRHGPRLQGNPQPYQTRTAVTLLCPPGSGTIADLAASYSLLYSGATFFSSSTTPSLSLPPWGRGRGGRREAKEGQG